MPDVDDASPEELEQVMRFIDAADKEAGSPQGPASELPGDFSHDEEARRLYGLAEMEQEAVDVLRLIVQQTERGHNLNADLVERAKAILDRYDSTMMRGHKAPNVVSIRRE
jgi:hypothetical protein